LAHAGRKAGFTAPWKGERLLPLAEGGWEPVAPSAVAFSEHTAVPKELSTEGIHKVIRDFMSATQRALDAGFRIIEIHAAHGYLLHEFLSPLSNIREDDYGGSFENRSRLLLEVISAVKTIWPDNYPLFVRISSTDWVDGGWTIEESVRLAGILKLLGTDLIDCSSGGVIPGVTIPLTPGYQVPLAAKIRREAGIPTGAVGLITTATQAESILENGEADIILMARELLRDPYFPLRAANELGIDIKWPDQYLRAKKKL
jgi:2,4-dienoyl-CoA reductase-like NADH-dependent reductase (Old Yellow Enzyme family)